MSHDVLSRRFSTLENAAQKLNSESDSLKKYISDFEEKLRSLRLGLEVWLEEPLNEDDPAVPVEYRGMDMAGRLEKSLGFAKGPKNWELRIRYTKLVIDPETESWVVAEAKEMRLLDAPRGDRIAAAAVFPRLLDELTGAAEAAVSAIGRARKRARDSK